MKILYSKIIGQGEPVIILHGFLGMSDNWKTQGSRIAELGFEVHLVDQRNHGRSFHEEEFNYDVMAEDLLNYLDAHGLSRIILLGHSMGGKTAMLFTAKYPERVDKLVVNDISPRFYPIHHDVILRGLNSLDFDKISSRTEAEHHLAEFVPEASMRQFLLKNLRWYEKGKLGFRFNLKALTESVEEVGEALPWNYMIDNPTLFLRGDRSEYITYQDEGLINTQFTDAEIITISNAGHWLHADNPDEFFEAIKTFIT